MSGRRVYSTENGRICPNCDRAVASCSCKKLSGKKQGSNAKNANIPQDGIVRLMRDTKGRKGAGATVVHGIDCEAAELKKIARSLKQLCGSGGSIKQNTIEIQGDHREKLKVWLEQHGYTVKLAGG